MSPSLLRVIVCNNFYCSLDDGAPINKDASIESSFSQQTSFLAQCSRQTSNNTMMTNISIAIFLALVALASSAPSGYYSNYAPMSYSGAVPALPPFGAPAVHPAYGYGHKNNGYVTVYRYESNVRSPYRADSAYAYKVDGQAVQVARVNSH